MCAAPRTALKRGLVIDAVPLLRMGIARIFDATHIDLAGEFDRYADAASALARRRADVLVLGSPSDTDVLTAALGLLRAERVEHVFVLLDRINEEDLGELLASDVDAVLLRSAGAKEVSETLRDIAAGKRVIGPGVAMANSFGAGGAKDFVVENDGLLTPKESQVLMLLAEGKSNNAIAEQLFVTLPTVKTHIAHIYAKLEVNRRADAIARALSLGLLR